MTQQKNSNQVWKQALEASAARFAESNLDFSREQTFAAEQLLKNDFLLKVARENPSSLKLAMYNVAAIGLTLNPNQGLCYLIPRRIRSGEPHRVVLDISYRGLISIGVDTGSILWAKSELVYHNDEFSYQGPAAKPIHICDPFSNERGELIGAYCIAELPTGSFMVETMSLKEMNKIRDKSEAYKNGVGPWIDWEEQMYLKCPVKRGSKWWPSSSKLSRALQILNEDNGEGIVIDQPMASGELPPPLPRAQVSIETQNFVKSLVDRAVLSRGFEACKEIMELRIGDLGERSFALSELNRAKDEYLLGNQKTNNPVSIAS